MPRSRLKWAQVKSVCARCCCCCLGLKPRYRRLVDAIYPKNPADGLDKASMDKLIFYAVSSPEKFDRIGAYIAYQVERDIKRNRQARVIMSMDAMNALLLASHSQGFNLFVRPFLKVVKMLLETQVPDFQIVATRSFIQFSKIEEDTPSYHRGYDVFIQKFAALAVVTHDHNMDTTNQLRMAGVAGLHGVIRKATICKLQVNIWDKKRMELIVPALLSNILQASSERNGASMQEGIINLTTGRQGATVNSTDTPKSLAVNCLHDIMSHATFGRVSSVVKPVLYFLDNNNLWSVNNHAFAVQIFKLIMYSVQPQYSYLVIRLLMNHLDTKASCSEKLSPECTAIVNILYHIFKDRASESIGPSLLDIFHSLMNHLKMSITENGNVANSEFQEAVIKTLGEFAHGLPDYQKTAVMLFVLSKVPQSAVANVDDALVQKCLLRLLMTVALQYTTSNVSQVLSVELLHALLKMSLAPNPQVRFLVQRVLQRLLDRHKTLRSLEESGLELYSMARLPSTLLMVPYGKRSRQDCVFSRKLGPTILYSMYRNTQLESNTTDNFAAIHGTLAVTLIELGSGELFVELLQILLTLQDEAQNNPDNNSVQVHRFVASTLHLVCHLLASPSLTSHVGVVISERIRDHPCLLALPEPVKQCVVLDDHSLEPLDDRYLFSRKCIGQAVYLSGYDGIKILQPYTAPSTIAGAKSPTSSSILRHRAGIPALESPQSSPLAMQCDSINAFSRSIPRRDFSSRSEDMTVDMLRSILHTTAHGSGKKRLDIANVFLTASFSELRRNAHLLPSRNLQTAIDGILSKIPTHSKLIPSRVEECAEQLKPSFTFPKLFLY